MKLCSGLVPVCALSFIVFSRALPARAWTDARARSARVSVEVDDAGRARVFMTLRLRVRGGWLEGFEISGLDPDARLDLLKPPTLVSEQGPKWTPRARVRGEGRLLLSFHGKRSPRRGHYTLTFAYRTSLAHRATRARPGERTRFTWTLPGWQAGLEDVQVSVWAPSPRAEVVDASGLTPGVVRPIAGRSLLRFHRMHLPRATPWPVSFEVPDADLDPSLLVERDPPGVPAGVREVRGPARAPWGPTLLSLLSLCVFAWSQRGASVRTGQRVRFLLGARWRAVVAAALCILAGAFAEAAVRGGWWVLASLAGASTADRGERRPRFGQWRRLGRDDRTRLRWRAFRDRAGLVWPLDPLSWLGLAVPWMTLWYAQPYGARLREGWPWALLIAALALIWSPRRWGERAEIGFARVFRLARELRLAGAALCCRGFEAPSGRVSEPRLGVLPAHRLSGVQRLEVAADERRGARGFVVLAVSSPGAPADRWLAELGGARRVSPGGKRVCHLFVAADVAEVERTLEKVIAHCSARAHEVAARAA